jgi:hypothetical protein
MGKLFKTLFDRAILQVDIIPNETYIQNDGHTVGIYGFVLMISYRYFHDIRLSELKAAIITFGMIMEIQYMGLKEYSKHIINSDFSVRFSHIVAKNFSWHSYSLSFPLY